MHIHCHRSYEYTQVKAAGAMPYVNGRSSDLTVPSAFRLVMSIGLFP